MAALLIGEGLVEAVGAEAAALVILTPCHIREKAAEKVYSELGRMRKWKQRAEAEGRRMTVVVAGCVAQAEGAEILRRAAPVDIVVGPQNYHHLPSLLDRAAREGKLVDTELAAESKFAALAPAGREAIRRRGVTAFVTVQEGCDKFCTFCVVPYTRGVEVSRPVEAILGEVRHLARAGVREVTLIGQNVNAYHGEGPGDGAWTLGRLLHRVAEVPGIARVRYTTSHPRDVDDALIAAHRDLPQLMPFLHLPVQSGSDRVLTAMNRRHTAHQYKRTVERLRKARPDLALSSDFIVGYPGESDDDFRATLDLVREIGFAQAFSFKYSVRPGTPAAEAEDQVPEAVKATRLAELQDLLQSQQRAFNQGCVGTVLPVLFEKPGRHPGQLVGRSPYLQAGHADSTPDRIGQIMPAIVHTAAPNSLAGAIIPRPTAKEECAA